MLLVLLVLVGRLSTMMMGHFIYLILLILFLSRNEKLAIKLDIAPEVSWIEEILHIVT